MKVNKTIFNINKDIIIINFVQYSSIYVPINIRSYTLPKYLYSYKFIKYDNNNNIHTGIAYNLYRYV